MKKILIIFVLILSSCGIEYDGETKIVVKGKVVDSNNNPIANKEINLYVSKEAAFIPFLFYSPSEENHICKALTNDNGEYTMVIPKPTNNYSEIIVETNSTDNNLNQKQFRNIQMVNFMNYELNLPTSTLYNTSDLANLNITPNQNNLYNELKNIELIGFIPNENEYINLPEDYSYYYELQHLVKKNQTIILRYTVLNHNTNTTSIIDENIVINNTNQIDFTLNY